jgi:hypothetical protein
MNGQPARLQLVGYPRSGNTYLAAWCLSSSLERVSHQHWDYQQQRNLLAEGVATYVLIRDPADAVASWMAADRGTAHTWRQKLGRSVQDRLDSWAMRYLGRRSTSLLKWERPLLERRLDLWRQFYAHAQQRLLPAGARVVAFERIVDHSVARVLEADGFALTESWSKEQFEQRQRDQLPLMGLNAEDNLGSAFTGRLKPTIAIPEDITATYESFKSIAEEWYDRAVNQAVAV